MRADVALRMASLDQISPEIITKIATVIGSKLKVLGEMSREAYGGVNAVAEMFNRLDANTSKEILENIEQVNPTLVETIRHLMFVFEDLQLLDINAIKEVLAKVDRKILTVALKGTSEAMKNHMLQAMSQRGGEMLREDMEALGPVKMKEVEAAQQQIIAVVRQLEAEGVVSLKGTAGEQYVSSRIVRTGAAAAAPPIEWRALEPSPRTSKPAWRGASQKSPAETQPPPAGIARWKPSSRRVPAGPGRG